MATPIQYLDKAMTRLRDFGLVPEKTEEAPIVALLNRVSDLDNDKVVAIARTLSQASLFNQVVREQVEDGRIDTFERLANVWQKATRGDIAGRFDKVKRVYLDVVKDSKDQIEREQQKHQPAHGHREQAGLHAIGVRDREISDRDRDHRERGQIFDDGSSQDALHG